MNTGSAPNGLLVQLLPKINEIVSGLDGSIWQFSRERTANGINGTLNTFSAKIDSTEITLTFLHCGISHSSWGSKSFGLKIVKEAGPPLCAQDQADGSEVALLYSKVEASYNAARAKARASVEEERAQAATKLREYVVRELPHVIRQKLADWRSNLDGDRMTLATKLNNCDIFIVKEESNYFGQSFRSLLLEVQSKQGEVEVKVQMDGQVVEDILVALKKYYPQCFTVATPAGRIAAQKKVA